MALRARLCVGIDHMVNKQAPEGGTGYQSLLPMHSFKAYVARAAASLFVIDGKRLGASGSGHRSII